MQTTMDFKSLFNMLTHHKSYSEFRENMLPRDVSVDRLLNHFEFLSPKMLIIHGSAVSGVKFSTKEKSDLDVVCITPKAAFWPLEQLYNGLRKNLQVEKTAIDVSIVTCNELVSIIIDRSSSLSASFNNGFSIIYWRKKE